MAKPSANAAPDAAEEGDLQPLTERQHGLLNLIQGLDADFCYTLTVTCRGTEPWEVEKVVEHRDMDQCSQA